MKSKRKIIAIVGPTASGKTGIGVELAKELNGEIISADSRQVFRGLDLGTGKDGEPCQKNPNTEILNPKQIQNCEIENSKYVSNFDIRYSNLQNACRFVEGVPQWLIDIKNPGEKFTLFDYLPMARAKIEDIFSRGKTPIIVGGTGLYVQALVEGFELEQEDVISNLPAGRQAKVRNLQNNEAEDFSPCHHSMARNDIEKMTIEQLREMLLKLDSELYYKVDFNNPHRLIRAIEKAQEGIIPARKKPDFEVLQIGINLKREDLFSKIDDRVEERFEKEMLEEVIYLLASGVKIDWMIKIGLEYRIIGKFITAHSPVPLSRENPKSEILNPKQFNNLAIEQLNGLSPASAEINKIADQLRSLPEYEAMKQELKYAIHAFARRQLTWFRRFPEIKWLNNFDEIKAESKKFLK